jgi:hypothetical protein
MGFSFIIFYQERKEIRKKERKYAMITMTFFLMFIVKVPNSIFKPNSSSSIKAFNKWRWVKA